MEIENAVNQANKELANRFDFKGTKCGDRARKKRNQALRRGPV